MAYHCRWREGTRFPGGATPALDVTNATMTRRAFPGDVQQGEQPIVAQVTLKF